MQFRLGLVKRPLYLEEETTVVAEARAPCLLRKSVFGFPHPESERT